VRQRLTTLVEGASVVSWHREELPYETGRVLETLALWSTNAEERTSLARADIGVTGCDAAIAETASLVMFSRRGRPRTVSLLPPTHIAIVERRQLCMSTTEVFADHRDRFRQTASCTVVTGPSRTADIELTLTLGIHGPERVVVIVGP
jgi:L-lactate dehydrogenase complex protein LldG